MEVLKLAGIMIAAGIVIGLVGLFVYYGLKNGWRVTLQAAGILVQNTSARIKAGWTQILNWLQTSSVRENAKILRESIRSILHISNFVLGGIVYLLYSYFPDGLYVFAGLTLGAMIVGIAGIFYKEELSHSPDNPHRLSLYIEVGQGRSALITQGDKPLRVIQGGKSPEFSFHAFGLWWLYQKIIHMATGLYPYIPFFTEPKTYDLPRYRVKEQGGKKVYTVVEQGMPGYRSNHVRNQPTDWGFEYAGLDVQLIPFTVEGFAQYYIDRDLVESAYYGANSWNTLLDIALNSVIRSVLRSHATIDSILGAVPKNIWDPKIPADDFSTVIVPEIMRMLKEFIVRNDKTLADFGIVVTRVDFTDFKDELPPPERAKFLAAVLGREAGRAADLIGQGVAKAQKELLESHGDGTGASGAIIQGEALVRAAATDGGLISTLLAAVAKNQMRGS